MVVVGAGPLRKFVVKGLCERDACRCRTGSAVYTASQQLMEHCIQAVSLGRAELIN